jgi:hypothetical protein
MQQVQSSFFIQFRNRPRKLSGLFKLHALIHYSMVRCSVGSLERLQEVYNFRVSCRRPLILLGFNTIITITLKNSQMVGNSSARPKC